MLNSIRWRLQLWHDLLLVLVLVGFGLTAWQLQRATQLRRIDEELQQRVTVAAALTRRPFEEPGRPPFERFAPPNRRQESPRLRGSEEGRPRPEARDARLQDENLNTLNADLNPPIP